MVHALRNFISSQRGLVILGMALVGITIALPLIYAQTSNTRLVTAGVANDVSCTTPCIDSAEIVNDQIVNADINTAAAIAKSKLAALAIVDVDVAAGANIAGSKLAPNSVTSTEVADVVSLPTSLTVGTGTAITQILVVSATLTPASVAPSTSAEQTFTPAGFSGLATTDKVFVNGPTPTAGTGIVNVRVSAANTLAITFINTTAGALTPVSGTYTVVAIRS